MRRRIVDDDGLLGILSSNFLSVQKWIGGCCYCSRRGIFLHLLSLSSRVNLMHFLAARPNRLLLPNCSELPNFCYCRCCCLESLKLQQRNKFNFFTSSKERKMFTKFRIFGFSPSKSTLFVIKSLVNFSYPFQLHRAWCEKSFNSINGGLVRGRKYRCVIQDDKSISFFRLVRLKI